MAVALGQQMSNYPGPSSWDNTPPAPSSSSSSTERQGFGGSMDRQPAEGYSGSATAAAGATADGFEEGLRDGGLGWGSGDRSAMYNMTAGWGMISVLFHSEFLCVRSA